MGVIMTCPEFHVWVTKVCEGEDARVTNVFVETVREKTLNRCPYRERVTTNLSANLASSGEFETVKFKGPEKDLRGGESTHACGEEEEFEKMS